KAVPVLQQHQFLLRPAAEIARGEVDPVAIRSAAPSGGLKERIENYTIVPWLGVGWRLVGQGAEPADRALRREENECCADNAEGGKHGGAHSPSVYNWE